MKDSTGLLRNALSEWGLLYGRVMAEQEIEAWMRLFARTRPDVLGEALEKVTQNSERRPTPGILSAAIRESWEKRPLPGAPKFTSGKDHQGIACWFWEDDPATPAYAAKDCPEGRSFLALLKEMSELKSLTMNPRSRQSGTLDCQDCGQRYPTKTFFEHICLEKNKADARNIARGKSA